MSKTRYQVHFCSSQQICAELQKSAHISIKHPTLQVILHHKYNQIIIPTDQSLPCLEVICRKHKGSYLYFTFDELKLGVLYNNNQCQQQIQRKSWGRNQQIGVYHVERLPNLTQAKGKIFDFTFNALTLRQGVATQLRHLHTLTLHGCTSFIFWNWAMIFISIIFSIEF